MHLPFAFNSEKIKLSISIVKYLVFLNHFTSHYLMFSFVILAKHLPLSLEILKASNTI